MAHQLLAVAHSKLLTDMGEIVQSILYGSTAIFIENESSAMLVSLTEFPMRSIEEPTIEATFRGPLEGNVGIFVDGSPNALIAPMTFWSGFQAAQDHYEKVSLCLSRSVSQKNCAMDIVDLRHLWGGTINIGDVEALVQIARSSGITNDDAELKMRLVNGDGIEKVELEQRNAQKLGITGKEAEKWFLPISHFARSDNPAHQICHTPKLQEGISM